MEASKLSDIEFKIMVIRMVKELNDNYKGTEWEQQGYEKGIETIKRTRKI